jgi:hypothetical protein
MYAGYIGQLKIQIPWKYLASQPIHLELNEVYILLGTDLDKVIPEVDPEELQKRKQAMLKEIEQHVKQELSQALRKEKQFVRSYPTIIDITHPVAYLYIEKEIGLSWKGYVLNWVLTKIIRGLKVSVTSVHLRYEDEYSHPEVYYAFYSPHDRI